MNPALNQVLHEIEVDVSRAAIAAGQRLVEALRVELSKYKLHNHKLTVGWTHDYGYLGMNGEEWQLYGSRGRRHLPLLRLLDEIDDILGKCDDAVIAAITDTVL